MFIGNFQDLKTDTIDGKTIVTGCNRDCNGLIGVSVQDGVLIVTKDGKTIAAITNYLFYVSGEMSRM